MANGNPNDDRPLETQSRNSLDRPSFQEFVGKKTLAGVLGILLGGFGVHKFILGLRNAALIMLGVQLGALVIAVLTCGLAAPLMFVMSIIGIVEGIMYLTKSDEEFYDLYAVQKKEWF